MILTVYPSSFKSYIENPWLVLEVARACPMCKTRTLGRHGCVLRWVYQIGEREQITLFRLRCRPCHLTFTLLPDFLVPYTRYSASVVESTVNDYLAGIGSYRDIALAVTRTVLPAGSSKTDALTWTRLAPGFQRVHAWVARIVDLAVVDVQTAAAWVTSRIPNSTVVAHQTAPVTPAPTRQTRELGKRADLVAARMLVRMFADVPELNPGRRGWMSAWQTFVVFIMRRTPWRGAPRPPPEPRGS